MAKHISVRMAWHDNGWNGAICKNPKANTYCIGRFSYPGDAISSNRDVHWEQSVCGKACSKLDGIPLVLAVLTPLAMSQSGHSRNLQNGGKMGRQGYILTFLRQQFVSGPMMKYMAMMLNLGLKVPKNLITISVSKMLRDIFQISKKINPFYFIMLITLIP